MEALIVLLPYVLFPWGFIPLGDYSPTGLFPCGIIPL